MPLIPFLSTKPFLYNTIWLQRQIVATDVAINNKWLPAALGLSEEEFCFLPSCRLCEVAANYCTDCSLGVLFGACTVIIEEPIISKRNNYKAKLVNWPTTLTADKERVKQDCYNMLFLLHDLYELLQEHYYDITGEYYAHT